MPPLAKADAITMGAMGHVRPSSAALVGQVERPLATSSLKSAYACCTAMPLRVRVSSQVLAFMQVSPPRSGSFHSSMRCMPRFQDQPATT